MPKGEHLKTAHQVAAAMKPRTSGKRARERAAKIEAETGPVDAPESEEDLEAATLRLQIARANKEEWDTKRKRLDYEKERAKLITKDEAIDLSQAVALKMVTILDVLPERVRDRLPPGKDRDAFIDELEEVIAQAREDMAKVGGVK